MDLGNIYTIGLICSFIIAVLWSLLDKKKPPTAKEFTAKLVARALVIAVLFAVSVGFLSIAFI